MKLLKHKHNENCMKRHKHIICEKCGNEIFVVTYLGKKIFLECVDCGEEYEIS